jgi:tRNA A-37 threonylcarbamoyl transferase component Bud32
MRRRLELAPFLEEDLKTRLAEEGLRLCWLAADPLAGGRGSARWARLGTRPVVVKRERRGGWLALVLPDWYVLPGPFEREWRLASRLADLGLAPRPLIQEFLRAGPFFQVFVASEALSRAASLLDLWQAGAMDKAAFRRVGAAAGRLHRAGVLHGDLNAGNIMLGPEGGVFFLDLRHSRLARGAPAQARRRRNLARLGRSLHKIRATRGLVLPTGVWRALAEGYSEGWGEEEAWTTAWLRQAGSGHPLRSLLWKRISSTED